LKLLTTELPYDPEIPLLVIYANELEVVSWKNIVHLCS
jgi:hypothetical protein